jgi:hypothetical protein
LLAQPSLPDWITGDSASNVGATDRLAVHRQGDGPRRLLSGAALLAGQSSFRGGTDDSASNAANPAIELTPPRPRQVSPRRSSPRQ